MDPVAVVIAGGRTTSFYSWLTKFASYPQRSWIIIILSAAVAAIIAELVLKIRYTRTTGIVLCIAGILLLAYGAVLDYARYRVPPVTGSSTAWVWMPLTGAFLLFVAWDLRRRRRRTIHNRINRLTNAVADRIETLERERGAPHYVDQLTPYGAPVQLQLRSLVRRRRKQSSIFLTGLPGSGKTATLLRFARDCQLLRSARKRPLIGIYVDLAEYAAQTTETLSLARFIQVKFIDSDSPELDAEKAWAEFGRYVDWIFLFDNADEADLRKGHENWSQQLTKSFMLRYSRFNSFYTVVAANTRPENSSVPVVELGNLTDEGSRELLTTGGVNPSTADALTVDEGLYWFVRNPGMIKLLAPVLAYRAWANSDNVHEILSEAIDHVLQRSPQTASMNLASLKTTATSIIKDLMHTQKASFPGAPGAISKGFTEIAKTINSSPQEVINDLTILAEHGFVKLIPSRDSIEYIEFSSGAVTYFYVRALLDRPEDVPVDELLYNPNFRMVAVSLLQIASTEIVGRFLQEVESLLDSAITGINQDELAELRARIQWANKANKT